MSWHDPLESADGDDRPRDLASGTSPAPWGGWSQAPVDAPVGQSEGAQRVSQGGWVADQTTSWTGVAGAPGAQPSIISSEGALVGPDPSRPASPPVLWLGVSGLLIAAGLGFFFVGPGATAGVIGWVLAGPLAISVLGAFVLVDAKRAETGWYRPSLVADWGRRAVILSALVAVSLNAFLIANDVARGLWR